MNHDSINQMNKEVTYLIMMISEYDHESDNKQYLRAFSKQEF
jgi:hypothetical protein